MKLVVMGLGQCGGRVADAFARLNKRARARRKVDIILEAFAINTDITDLSGLSTIKANSDHRISIGGQKTHGHGVGKLSEIGADIAKESGDKIVDAVRKTRGFADADAILLIAGASGGTGSGAIAELTRQLKERYFDKPVYNLIVLPFQQEERTEARTIYNTAVCLKSVYLVADAVFLVDNQRYVNKDITIINNLMDINERLVQPFYNLLCAGEERIAQYVGAKVIDAGDITETLAGWTVLGEGRTNISRSAFSFGKSSNFRGRAIEDSRGTRAMDEALGELSLTCDPRDARRGLFLVSAPRDEINMGMLSDVAGSLRAVAPNALIRYGDYPRTKGSLDVAVLLSEFTRVQKITNYFNRAIELIKLVKARQGRIEYADRKIEDIFEDIPVLL